MPSYDPTQATEIDPVVSPLLAQNEVDALGVVSGPSLAREIWENHRSGLLSRRELDLICEKLMLHIDGSGDLQWADILHGATVEIPRGLSEFRKTENILRLIVDNAVAHHTTMPLDFFADSHPDQASRDRAAIDTIWINDLAQRQDFNGLFAEAMYFAMATAFTPVHAYWREDVPRDWYEAVAAGEMPDPSMGGMEPGMIDCWVGNRFGTVFDAGATRSSVRWCSYDRILNGDAVRRHFSHMPGVSAITGSTRLPSAAEFHRAAKKWMNGSLGAHGNPVISHRKGAIQEGEELLTTVCREIAPGADSRWPEGRLQMIAVPGDVDTMSGKGGGGSPVLLADQALPANDFSWTLFYSHHRGSDIHGKPWIEDTDQLQVDLNIAKSKRWEHVLKMAEAPIVAPGGAIEEDMADFGGYNIFEVEPSLASWPPRVMTWPTEVLMAFDKEIAELRQAIYTGGGFQASSRGEAPGSRMAYRAIVALQQADNTIHGPVNQRYRRAACDFARRCWSQFKAYGDIPQLVDLAGEEYAHLVDNYVSKADLSDRPPNFKLVNAFGTSPEMRAQEVLELASTRGADGQPFLTTAEARRQYPNQTIFGPTSDPEIVQKRRAKTIATAFLSKAEMYRQQTGMEERDPTHPWVAQAAQELFAHMEKQYPRLRDDKLDAHLMAYSEVTQNEQADPIARLGIMQRQNLYYEWQADMAARAAGHQPQQKQEAPGGARPRKPGEMEPGAIAAERQGSAQVASTTR